MLARLNEQLEEMARANEGANHIYDFELICLPDAESLGVSLGEYFSNQCTSNSPPAPAECWDIRVSDEIQEVELRQRLRYWLFRQEFSPKLSAAIEDEKLSEIVERLKSVVGPVQARHVVTNPPMFYECDWEDFAFENGSERWLLHMGLSD